MESVYIKEEPAEMILINEIAIKEEEEFNNIEIKPDLVTNVMASHMDNITTISTEFVSVEPGPGLTGSCHDTSNAESNQRTLGVSLLEPTYIVPDISTSRSCSLNTDQDKNTPLVASHTLHQPKGGMPNSNDWFGRSKSDREQQWRAQREKILELHAKGMRKSEIAEELEISLRTVSKWINRYREGGILDSHQRSGRPKALTHEQREAIIHAAQQDPDKPATQIKLELGLTVADITVRRTLQAVGLLCCGTEIKEPLTAEERKERLDFVKQYKSESEPFWQDVVYVDDKRFVISPDGQLKIMRERGSRFASSNIVNERERGRIAIAYVGFMLGHGVGELVKIDERMTGETYVKIFEEVVVPAVRLWALPEPNVLSFVHDNSAVHRSPAVQDFFRANPLIRPLNYPSNSSDLNPIESLWDLIVSEWDGSNIRTEESLHKHIMSVWEALRRRPEVCKNFASSMTRRLQDVEEADGGYIGY